MQVQGERMASDPRIWDGADDKTRSQHHPMFAFFQSVPVGGEKRASRNVTSLP